MRALNSPDYQSMDLKDLYHYMITHRSDDEAFYAYVDRSKAAGRMIQVDVSDPDWEEKMDREMRKRMSDSRL